MENHNKTVTGRIGIPSILLIVFIVLKVTHLISWSWVWVLSPLWITLLISLILGIIIGVIRGLK